MKNIAIILASGSGKRAGFDLPKQFQKIKDKTICEISIEAFEKNEGINEIILVVNEQYKVLLDEIVAKNNYKKITKIVFGGAERIDSSRNGVFAIDEEESNILIHDCVRPFVSQRIINDCINALNNHSAVDVAANVTDTIFIVENNIMKEIPPRRFLKKSQTPQCFKLSLIKKAHKLAQNEKNIEFTDDCGLILRYNLTDIFIVEGEEQNIKITYKDDMLLAENIYARNLLP